MSREGLLRSDNHDRDSAGFSYVYPVISRRAGGVSIGINLNPNNQCNWHCIYCQVPNLERGHAPEVNETVLRQELVAMLEQVLLGDFMQQRVPDGCRQLQDIAFSGNGEATSSRQFPAVVALVVKQMKAFNLSIPLRLITNGSYVQKAYVQQGLLEMARHHGEVWIKLDAAQAENIARINGIQAKPEWMLQNIEAASRCCPTWIQSCMFKHTASLHEQDQRAAYLALLQQVLDANIPVKGILLYGLARPSMQKEAANIQDHDHDWMHAMAEDIRALGFTVQLQSSH